MLENETSSALQSLIELGHLREKGLKKGDEVELRLEVTELGQATFKGIWSSFPVGYCQFCTTRLYLCSCHFVSVYLGQVGTDVIVGGGGEG